MEIIAFKNVSEKYRIKFVIDGKESWEDFWALKTVSFSVDKGQTLAIIGENGAGKSTILKLIAGMLKVDKGEVYVQGKVAALLELGAGFYPEFTGRENIYLNTSLFGLAKEEVDAKLEEIVEFSGIGRFIDAQIKSYSQGMFVRLAFAIAIHINPDILLIDDSLSVGDEDFQKKCVWKILELKKAGKTIIFVTHDMNMARRFCAKGIFLRSGKIIKEGPIDSVISYYMETLGDRKGIALIQKDGLGLVFNNGRLILRWADKTMTQGQSVYSSFLFGEHCFNSPTANWHAEIKNARQIVAKGTWYNIPVSQVWDISLLDDGQFQLKVALEACDKFSVENFQVELLFREEYKRWFSSEHEGIFSENSFHERECELIYDDPNDKLAGLKGGHKENGSDLLPAVIVDAFGQQTQVLCQILNSGLDLNARIIRLKIPGLNDGVAFDSGSDSCHIMKIKFIDNAEPKKLEGYMDAARNKINAERLKFKNIKEQSRMFNFSERGFGVQIDDNNFLHILKHGKKLTSDPGIRTSLLIGREWRDSYAKNMCIERISGNHIRIHNILFKDLPINQTWVFQINEEEGIHLSIETEFESPVNVREINIDIFVSRDYSNWFTADERGALTNEFNKWKEIVLKKENIKNIGVISRDGHAIVLDVSADARFSSHIYSSDNAFSSHLLRAQAEGLVFQKSRVKLFEGIIRLVDDESIFSKMGGSFYDLRSEDIASIFDTEYLEEEEVICLDDKEMSGSIDALSSDSQNRIAEIIKMLRGKKAGIAVSRFNFFKIGNILKFYTVVTGKQFNPSDIAFNPFPVRTICESFIAYVKKIKPLAQEMGIRLTLKDKELPELLKTISKNAKPSNGSELLRLLGVICEYAFVGPRTITIDSYHGCNTDCVHCWFHNPKIMFSDNPQGMNLDLYRKIIDDAQALSTCRIMFEGEGEPLLDKIFFEKVEYAWNKGFKIGLSTNGILLEQGTSEKLLRDLEVEMITCSLPAANSRTYALINRKQPPATFDKIIGNLKTFIKIRDSLRIDKSILRMNHVIHALNYKELIEMCELDANIGADVVQFVIIYELNEEIKHLRLNSQQLEMIKNSLIEIKEFLKKKNILLDDTVNFQLQRACGNLGAEVIDTGANHACYASWFQASIFADSAVSMCGKRIINKITEASLKEIWESESYNNYRIQAKQLKNNKNMIFLNDQKLFAEQCKRCLVFSERSRIDNLFKQYNLERFLKL